MGFKENLKEARKKLGLTQEEVAEQLCVTKSTYCGYETGKRKPDVEKIKKLANILEVKADTLLDTDFKQTSSNNEEFSEKERKLITAYRNQPEIQYAVDRLLGIDN